MHHTKHWQDAISVLVGIWVAISAWFLGYGENAVAMYHGLVVGIALVATALGAMLLPRAWEEWTELVLGLWLAVSPWLLGFSGSASATNNAVASGVLVVALALWVLFTDQDFLAASDGAAH
jgi:hypothetical protein